MKFAKVKRSENGVIIDPFFLTPEHTIAEADELSGPLPYQWYSSG